MPHDECTRVGVNSLTVRTDAHSTADYGPRKSTRKMLFDRKAYQSLLRNINNTCSGCTTSLEHVDRGSLYVIEHHHGLFSWKKIQ
jgi:hypothetical protein